jgi:CoA:oxalate CoA-transferase
VTVDHAALGPLKVPGVPIKLSGSPGSVRTPPPRLGEDTEAVLAGVGYSGDEIASLRETGAV